MSRSLSSSPRSREAAAIKKRAQRPPPSKPSGLARRPGGVRLHPGKEPEASYFFLAFLAFFAFFAFFAFLAIVSSQGLMVERDTRHARRRASLATSSEPNSTDSRRAAPRCHATVIVLSTAVTLLRVIFARESALPRRNRERA